MKQFIFFSILLTGHILFAQTDETIFREFRFDFTTPGARANALGKAFVGLSDEATSAYNNPAGLSVLEHPEITLEYQSNKIQYAFLQNTDSFELINGDILHPEIHTNRCSFASISFSKYNTNFSLFYVNQLQYSRELPEEISTWYHIDIGYNFFYGNQHRVQLDISTYGLSFGRAFSRLSFGAAIGLSQLDIRYKYSTRLISYDLELDQLVLSETNHNLSEFSCVLGMTYQIHPKIRIGASYKSLPSYKYSEKVQTLQDPEYHSVPIRFKVPDSLAIGLSCLPTDRITIVLDFNRIWYHQLAGDNFTVISGDEYTKENYITPDATEKHIGIEYLLPWRKHIFAFRCGAYENPDHKTRFTASTSTFASDIQAFVFNTGSQKTMTAYTIGLGYVWKNKLQTDMALVHEGDQFHSFITSFLYRFGKK
ncbi:MAG: hypothetical protein CR997_07955 [Acidobacteria bacterium]|nr:MAG: hypothetical protein CR997_07955 [Acidobacteriota bacterium]